MNGVREIEEERDDDGNWIHPETKQPIENIGLSDWKDPPDEVLEQCNQLLKLAGIDQEFVMIGGGQDNYLFFLEKTRD